MNTVFCTLLAVVAAAQPLPPQATPLPPLPPDPTAESIRMPGETRRFTLDEAIALALKSHPTVLRSQAQVAQSAGAVRATRSRLFPSIAATYQYQTSSTGGSSFGGMSGGLTSGMGGSSRQATDGSSGGGGSAPEIKHTGILYVTQLVTDFGRTRAGLTQAREGLASSREGLSAAEWATETAVRQSYYGLLQAQGLVGVQKANVEARRASLAVVQARFNAGAAPYGEVARATAAVAQAQAGLAQALAGVEQARVALNQAIGIDPATPTEVAAASEKAPELPPLAKLVEEACARRPELRQLGHALGAQGAALRSARKGNLPSLSLSYVEASMGANFIGDYDGRGAIVSLSWSPWDAGTTRGQVEQAQAQIEDTRGLVEQTRLAIGAEVTRAYQDVRSAEMVVTSARIAAASAQESLRITRERYKAGLSPLVEVSDAEAALVAAETDRVNSEYAVSRARAALTYALGPAR